MSETVTRPEGALHLELPTILDRFEIFRHGVLRDLEIDDGTAIATIDCGEFRHRAISKHPQMIEMLGQIAQKAFAAGVPATIFAKGPISEIQQEGFEPRQVLIRILHDLTRYPVPVAEY